MLQTKVLEQGTLDLLKQLMQLPSLRAFDLVGGTSLALQYGHRISIDLDFFGNVEELNFQEIESEFAIFEKVVRATQSRVMLGYNINNVKVDIVKYQYGLISAVSIKDGIRLATPKDIAPMKIAAITGRGKKKDFYDLFYLLKEYSFKQIFGFYDRKYPDGNRFLAYRSITYFEDADKEVDPFLFENITWEEVKKEIQDRLQEFLNNE